MRKRFTHPSKSSEDNNYFQLKKGPFPCYQPTVYPLLTDSYINILLTLVNYHFEDTPTTETCKASSP